MVWHEAAPETRSAVDKHHSTKEALANWMPVPPLDTQIIVNKIITARTSQFLNLLPRNSEPNNDVYMNVH